MERGRPTGRGKTIPILRRSAKTFLILLTSAPSLYHIRSRLGFSNFPSIALAGRFETILRLAKNDIDRWGGSMALVYLPARRRFESRRSAASRTFSRVSDRVSLPSPNARATVAGDSPVLGAMSELHIRSIHGRPVQVRAVGSSGARSPAEPVVWSA